MISPETQAPHWEWYYVALYFYIGGVSAGAYFLGSLIELLNRDSLRPISRLAYLIAFPLICITPFLLIADLGQPLRFWHLFISNTSGLPSMNLTSPLSVGTWALAVYMVMSFLSFLNALVADGRLRAPLVTRIFAHIPHKLYALVGSFFGFFVAGYTGVLLNVTSRPLWEATDPLVGSLFIVSAASSGAAAVILVTAVRKIAAHGAIPHLKTFDRFTLLLELALLIVMLLVAGRYAVPLLTGYYGILFWGGVVLLGIGAPLWLSWSARRPLAAMVDRTQLTAVLVLFGSALLRITIVQAGQL